jgi:hypothetical protein
MEEPVYFGNLAHRLSRFLQWSEPICNIEFCEAWLEVTVPWAILFDFGKLYLCGCLLSFLTVEVGNHHLCACAGKNTCNRRADVR